MSDQILEPGKLIGAYRIVRFLGEGGTGAVYEVEHVTLGVCYALKTYSLAGHHAEFFRERFATEGKLLARLAAERTGEDENTWVRFFELYQPVIAQFAVMVGTRGDAEDVAQDIFAKLVEVFRNGAYDPRRGRFRSFLSTMIRNEVINRWHRDVARAADRHFSIDDAENPVEVSTPSATEAILDAKWRLACHEEAVDHVLNRTALSAKSKAIYRAYVLEDRPIDEVAAAFGVPRNSVSQVKTRVERMIAEHEALLGYS